MVQRKDSIVVTSSDHPVVEQAVAGADDRLKLMSWIMALMSAPGHPWIGDNK